MIHSAASAAELERAVRNVPDFPKKGIQFKDITPVLADPNLFSSCIGQMIGRHAPGSIDTVVGIDARGFIFAAAAAIQLKAGFVPIRKKGKLPYTTHEESYDLEYGSNTVAVHTDAVGSGKRVLVVDDLLATGGTAGAALKLLRKLGANVVEAVFFIELGFLKGREKLPGVDVRSIVVY